MKEYFSHDHYARHDRKIEALVSKYKSAGYGVFWATNEMMHEEGGELEMDDITFLALAKHLNEQSAYIQEVIKYCISPLKLYILDNDKLTSIRVRKNLTDREEKKLAKSEKAAIAGRIGGIKSGESRRSKQTLQANEATLEAKRSNEAKVKESKVKESKGNMLQNSNNGQNDSICYDAEHFISNNHIIFDKICIATLKGADEVKKELHNYHLWLAKNEKYPTGKAAVVAGVESWILNAKNFKSKYNVEEKVNGSSSIKKESEVDFDKYKKVKA